MDPSSTPIKSRLARTEEQERQLDEYNRKQREQALKDAAAKRKYDYHESYNNKIIC
jgi:hypothetical protein